MSISTDSDDVPVPVLVLQMFVASSRTPNQTSRSVDISGGSNVTLGDDSNWQRAWVRSASRSSTESISDTGVRSGHRS